MLKYVLASVLFVLSFSTMSTPSAEAGIFSNRPVRTFFQNRKPVRKLLKAGARLVAAPVKFVAKNQPIRSTLRGAVKRATFTPSSSSRSGGCVNCGTEG